MEKVVYWKMKSISLIVLSALLSACGGGGGGSGSNGSGLDIGSHNQPNLIEKNNQNRREEINNSTNSTNNDFNNQSNNSSSSQSENNNADSKNSSSVKVYPTNNTQTVSQADWTYKQLSKTDLENAKGEGVYVGLVDTGLNREAKGLVNRNENITKKSIDFKTKKLVDSYDISEHGTGITEIILDTAPKVAINSGYSNPNRDHISSVGLDNLLAATKTGAKVNIINNSYGSPVLSDDWETVYGKNYEHLKYETGSTEIKQQNGQVISTEKAKIVTTNVYIPRYQEFINNGALVIKSTGNDGKKIASTEAALPLVAPDLEKGFLSVTAYDQRKGFEQKTQNACGELTKNWCVTAPEIFEVYGLSNTKNLWSGTSTAAAYVSGLAAKIKSRYDWFTNIDLKNTLITTADDMGEEGVDAVWGNGLVNETRSLKGYGRFDNIITLNVDGVKRAYYFDNDISGSGGVIKKGKDILVVNGNNTYTGNTTIAEGEWVANGHSLSKHIIREGASLTIGDQYPTIQLNSIDNQGTLSVSQSNLKINGDFNSSNGLVEQAIGTNISVTGTANLNNATWSLIGTKKGYVTKQGQTEILLNAKHISGKDQFQFLVANASLGELINQKYNLTDTELSITTSRKTVGDIVRNQEDFIGKDKTVIALDGLLDNIDETKLANNYKNYDTIVSRLPHSTAIQTGVINSTGLGIANALANSSNLNKTVFEIDGATSQHSQESIINQKNTRSNDLLAHTLQLSSKGSTWTTLGYGKTKSKGSLSTINGESKDNSQTLGIAYRLGEQSFGIQLNYLSHKWTEKFAGSLKEINTKGAGLEAAYTFQYKDYWLATLAGIDWLNAKTHLGSDHGNQYSIGIHAGKNFSLLNNRLNLMPNVGLKYAQISGLNYRLQKYNNDIISTDNTKTRETSLTTGLNSTYQLDEKGKLLLTAGISLQQILDGKTTYTANYGGYLTNISDTSRKGKRPNIVTNLGVDYYLSDNIKLYLNGVYENGKYLNKRAMTFGINAGF